MMKKASGQVRIESMSDGREGESRSNGKRDGKEEERAKR